MADWLDSTTDRIPTDIVAGYGIPNMYSARVIEAQMHNLVCVGAVDTTWRAELYRGALVYIPVMSNMTAHIVDLTGDWGGSNAHMNTNVFDTGVTITCDEWYECPFQLSDGERIQTQIPDLLGKAAKNAGYQIAKAIDTNVNALFSGGLTTTWQGSDGQTFSDDLLINLMEGLDEADVPRSERSLIVDPSCRADMYRIDKFIHRDYNQTLTGEIGKTPYGDVILITNNLSNATTGNYGALLHKEAIGCVIQMPPKVETYRYASRHSDVINVSAIFGSDVVRKTYGAVFYTRDQA